ncbi:hypothetical protein VTK56DRAFT_7542 [Thermocarpiscus australiensis]
MAENAKGSARCKVKGVVHFPPFEALDEASLREVRRFQVYPFGSIQDTCRRIPYNSGKKDFFSKTGREMFEVFQYDFKVPGDDTSYTVMWDYNVGLVRMTPFFKCRGYSKTTPAKMLSQNPGLKDITYSITGGSIKAQGYWMPYSCAKAVCATFCHRIAGALIPLFGPQFPFECVPEKAAGHGRMIIDPEIVARAKRDAELLFRRRSILPSPRSSRSVSPMPLQRQPYDYQPDYDRRLLLSPYGTDTDADTYHHGPGPGPYGRQMYPGMPSLRTSTAGGSRGRIIAGVPTPMHSPGWTAVNKAPTYPHNRSSPYADHENHNPSSALHATANPWLTAVPRSPRTPGGGRILSQYSRQASPDSRFLAQQQLPGHQQQQLQSPGNANANANANANKRGFDRVVGGDDEEEEYDAGESQVGSSSSPPVMTATVHGDEREQRSPRDAAVVPPAETARLSLVPGSGLESAGGVDSAPASPSVENVRPAAERDAAIMLMHMMGRQEPSQNQGDEEGSWREGPSQSQSPSQKRCRDAERNGGSGREIDGAAGRDDSRPAVGVDDDHRSSVGPATRAKRRRTLM